LGCGSTTGSIVIGESFFLRLMLVFLYGTSRGLMRTGVLDSAAHRNRNGTYSFVGPKIAACASISGVEANSMNHSLFLST
jgi:hypothetical protein